ncbi:MAG: hypothetical protein JNM07_09520 [Phycisphaerae bacterium]|nr:hypothetical protein [Phycisphaerae bacterium]
MPTPDGMYFTGRTTLITKRSLFRLSGGTITRVLDLTGDPPGDRTQYSVPIEYTYANGIVTFVDAAENGSGLYAVINDQAHAILETGDILDGKSVLSINSWINARDGNRLAFWVRFSDDTQYQRDQALYIVTITPPCAADFNGDTSADDFDYFDFLSAFFADDPSADFNGDTGVYDFDYFDFLNAFGAGC